MKELEIKKDGSVYIQPDNLFVESQMEGHHIVAKHHPETAINSTILCNPGIYPIPDLQWEVKRTCKWHGNLDACGNETCWDLVECQNSPEKFLAILKESTPSTEQESQEQIFDDMFCKYFDYRYEKGMSGYHACLEIQKQFTITRR